jgi:hypothetical protein
MFLILKELVFSICLLKEEKGKNKRSDGVWGPCTSPGSHFSNVTWDRKCNNNGYLLFVCTSVIRSSNQSTDSWHLEDKVLHPGS